MSNPILSILIPALPQRKEHWTRLIEELRFQREHVRREVEIIVNDSETLLSGAKRQELINKARGEYVCFIDDDDWVAPNYVKAIHHHLVQAFQPDVVTFNLRMTPSYRGETIKGRDVEIWKFHLGDDDRENGVMAANHLCVWRESIARLVGWCPSIGYGDDQLWYKPLNRVLEKRSLSRVHIDDVLYYYFQDLSMSVNQNRENIRRGTSYFGKEGVLCYYDMSGRVLIENKAPSLTRNRSLYDNEACLIDPHGQEVVVNKSFLTPFLTVGLDQ